MELFKLGLTNVRRNFKNYFSYFISILVSVFILTLFYSIYYNDAVHQAAESKAKVLVVFKMAAVFVMIFSAIFIWYSNDFFLKKKKKEVAIYSLVGMSRKEIGILMFGENICLGVLALIIGVPLGSLSSGFFLKILAECIKSSTPIQADFKIKAILMTVMAFAVIFVLNSVKAYKVVYKYRLIELLHASEEGEKQPKFSRKLSVLSVAMILGGYIIALTMDMTIGGTVLIAKAFIITFLVIAGTYLLFNNLIIFILKMMKENKKTYYKGENLIGISGLIYRIKGNSNLLAAISVISSIAITALCFTFSFNSVIDEVVSSGCPFGVLYVSGIDALDSSVEDAINDNGEDNISFKADYKLINGKGLTAKYKGPFESNSSDPFHMYIMSLSEYEDIIENSYLNKGTDISARSTDININDKNDCFFIETTHLSTGRGRLTGDNLDADIGGKQYDLNISDSDIKCVIGIKLQDTTVVLTDELFDELLQSNKNNTITLRAYKFDNPLKNEKIVENINKIMPDDRSCTSYYDSYVKLHSLYGSFVFIGMFIGILFIFSTGSMLYYKLLMEANEEKERYDTLFKIGLRKKEVLRIVVKQIGLIFASPIALALINSGVALGVYVLYMANGSSPSAYVIQCILGMMAAYVATYVLYYIISVKSYMKIISHNA